jgi:ubiquinone/menaquinone biosynthesis C-methylase UbiE
LTFIPTALAIAMLLLVVGQCRKPRGWVGRFHIWLMNKRHADVTAWGIGHVRVEPAFTILDIGCGGGAAVERLAATASQGHVDGVDYSAASVAAARSRNLAAIAEGRVEIQQASVSALPFGDGTFDLVTAVETHYYWPNLGEDLREVRRVLEPGGQVVVIAEVYRRKKPASALFGPIMRLLGGRYVTADEHRAALMQAGFVEVAVHEDRRGWICATGRSPMSPSPAA